MQLSRDFCRAMSRVSPQARPPSPTVGSAFAKQTEPVFEPVFEAGCGAVVALLEHPASSARLTASRESRIHGEHWRAVCPVIPVPLYQEACSRACLLILGPCQDIIHLRLDVPQNSLFICFWYQFYPIGSIN